MSVSTLSSSLAGAFARTALANIGTEYPYKLDQVLGAAHDLAAPRELHPAFWGSYDWHSCVHMHWTIVRLLRRFPAQPESGTTREHLDRRLTRQAVDGELATLRGPHRQTFERPYGWGWLLKLAAELELLAREHPRATAWRDAVRPLADEIADRFLRYLPKTDHPTRTGTHTNTAFALLLALDWCDVAPHTTLRRLIEERANRWFGRDQSYPAGYEPGGEDFLSPGLVEAALMLRVAGDGSFADWWTQFQPSETGLAAWLTPVAVSDNSDARIVHLHGLNLSRAWCWRLLESELPAGLQERGGTSTRAHLDVSLPAATGGHYVGTHWLASFALLALDHDRPR